MGPTVAPYKPKHHVRIVTAASLFDGHDASINIMRRFLQASGAEVIHLGHNRSVAEIVDCAIQEDVQGIAMTSYQGGHLEYLKYMYDLLKEHGADIKIFAGGGGTILPAEIEELHNYGITRIYSPDDGRNLGLQGMINDVLEKCDFETQLPQIDDHIANIPKRVPKALGKVITVVENYPEEVPKIREQLAKLSSSKKVPVLGITGTGGAGKSSMVDELIRRYLLDFDDKTIAVISVDPSKRKTGGALLGDRIRMNSINSSRVYMRSLATRQANLALNKHVQESIDICQAAGFDLVIVETSGIGQSDTEITEHSDISLYVMTAEYGAATQLEKIDMLDFADIIVINKFDKRGSLDALRDVRKQYRRNHNKFDQKDADLPILGTIASQFNDPGTNRLYKRIIETIEEKTGVEFGTNLPVSYEDTQTRFIIPPERSRYLAEIVESNKQYEEWAKAQAIIARSMYQIMGTILVLRGAQEQVTDYTGPITAQKTDSDQIKGLIEIFNDWDSKLEHDSKKNLSNWPSVKEKYSKKVFEYQVRDKVIKQDLVTESLSHLNIPKISLPKFHEWGDLVYWLSMENLPGEFPYAAGIFPLKRQGEDPARMFAGEGGPERTNRRFHYVSQEQPAKRLSTAFDSVTLYGEDPDHRPDIFGKIGNSGVSVANLDDAKKLYSGFNLSSPTTSVSMTINGPAPMLLGFFLNAAIDQQCEVYIKQNGLEEQTEAKIKNIYATNGCERPRYQGTLPASNDGLGLMLLGVTGDQVLPPDVYAKIKVDTLSAVRGTVQADILKEDQAQNTCIFSTEFALRMMGDVQQYFIDKNVRNFYSVSISGYHIAEAGANPISQVAFTLANGFTFIEYYLSRGMKIDEFASNLSFFFSNGLDAEYAVIGRVARRIWSKALRQKYGANDKSQKLKYHIQTSGRSLHAQEISFNDIRTTLQAVYALYDNCNSLHTNAYDEAITTPTEESVRRAMAIQLIINKELGLFSNENMLQGSFIIEELTDLVENAIYGEFQSINERGGVLGAMERMYQRTKIQEESMYYEGLKHSGVLPLVGVNTFLDSKGSPTIVPDEVIRSTTEEKEHAISSRDFFQKRNKSQYDDAIATIRKSALQNGNIFEALMEASKVLTLGQISNELYKVGGQYRRSM